MGSSLRNGVVIAVISLLFIGLGAAAGVRLALERRTERPFLTVLSPTTVSLLVLPSVTPRPTFTPANAPAAQDGAILQVSSPTPEMTATLTATETIAASPTPVQVLFRVVAPQVQFYAGPGTAYPAIAAAQQGAVLPVISRTPNGIWWEVCCLQGQTVWLMLDGKTVLEQGDVNLVILSSATIYDATPTPSAVPAPPTPAAPPFSAPALPPAAAMRSEPTPAPTATYEPANPACAIPGATYGTQAVMGESDRRPAQINPEYNLALRSYALVDGFRQMVGIGGDTDRHAPQLNTLFADSRITQDFPAVYQVHQWDYDCNCRTGLITAPEVTALGVSSREGELLYTPDRTEGDIGGGYRALVLYASPTSLTLKYTREDNMLYGYGIHLDGICVDPTLLEFYRELDRAGRQTLPALNGGQPIGYSIGGEIRVAVRDTGQFMDPRSQKDWWAGE